MTGGECRGLSPLELYALLHLEQAGTDYALSLARAARVDLEATMGALEALEARGLAERRAHGSALKNTVARMKLSREVRKHHTYYTLTREGRLLARRIRHGLLGECIDRAAGEGASRLLGLLRRVGIEHAETLARLAGMPLGEALARLEALEALGLVTSARPKTIKASKRRAKPKRETRAHHRYYSLTRLAELLLRAAGRS